MVFKIGVIVDGMTYGWYKKELYRLPQVRNRYTLSLKKLNKIQIGNINGYRMARKYLKTVQQCKDMTILFDIPIIVNNIRLEDYPF